MRFNETEEEFDARIEKYVEEESEKVTAVPPKEKD
jgi:hypothetical protein